MGDYICRVRESGRVKIHRRWNFRNIELKKEGDSELQEIQGDRLRTGGDPFVVDHLRVFELWNKKVCAKKSLVATQDTIH